MTGKRTPANRRWITEPILTGLLGLILLVLWQLAYSWQLARSGAVPVDPFSSGFGLLSQMFLSALWLALPVTVWVLLAILGNWLARNRGFGARMLMAWCAAVVLALPPAIYFAIMLAQTDGQGNAGIVAVLVPALATLLVLPAYATAHVLLNVRDSMRAKRRPGGDVPLPLDAD